MRSVPWSPGARYDVVYDAATGSGGGEDYAAFRSKVVATNGRRIAINGGLKAWLKCLLGWQRADDKLILTRQNGEQLSEILGLLRNNEPPAAPVVDSTHTLSVEGVDAAFARLKSRRSKGKIILTVA